ncbi:hypothetical protein GNP81_04890 [Aliivibrio fischeri]|uniref:hypothetical protein n=2 Tax=Aliivibrio fischeri TaxID=668 RepID=UPI0013132B73|nr:hypothetical protein [Aliivibrio fischeri]MUK70135.1 hypothetical protein [Aliivibrio fischeri]MUK72669.1 hypothetical protein [Aliivibrio fischeri]MUK77646.1 hypothetical protein [Aliivibrio fischeri]MUL20164.1 hypothetical protein [Aliivibrio fischeri]
MKISELIQNLQSIQKEHGNDIEVVTGEEWFPEQLLTSSVNHNMAFLKFDRLPCDIPAEIDARGFLEHEEILIKQLVNNVIFSELEPEMMVDKLTDMLVFSHENISCDVVEHFSQLENKKIGV